jgi:tetratricopeptide (TPR) repeat protein
LEALAAILSADRNTTLPDLLAQTAQLPDNVVEALVGQAFHRLDPLAQQIMQALAIYPVPVPAVAVDYLLQPYQPAIDSVPVLARLVNMQFVRRDAGRYYLHQVDRDYALSRIPTGHPGDSDTDSPPFTQHALRSRGADYFTRVQTPREEWKTLDDLAPQLAEFELRCQNETYDTAAAVLLGIDFDCLMQWGHYRLNIDLHTRIQDHITDPRTVAASTKNLAAAHRSLGEFPKAIKLLEQALTTDRETGDRAGEGTHLTTLANCYYELGQMPRAIELYGQALTIDQEIGYRDGETIDLGNLGNCYANLGQIPRAIDLYEQALDIAREIGNRREEAANLDRLASCHSHLGEMPRAIELYEQARAIDLDIGHRYGEAIALGNLGEAYTYLGQWERAIGYSRQALEVADAIGSAQGQAGAMRNLAFTHLYAGDLPSARQVIEGARDHPYPSARARFALVSGIIHLRQGATNSAAEAFHDAIARADGQLHQNSGDYVALDTKATALTGLSLAGPTDRSADAIAAFRAARNLTTAAGIVTNVLRQLDALTPADPSGVLHRIRPAAAGLER